MEKNTPAILVLEDGTVYHGHSFGHPKDVVGEVCFTTAMSGYQETLTDPSYRGQIITFTYPMIGNYGIHDDHGESEQVHASGLVVREYVERYSSPKARTSLGGYLQEQGVPGISGVDTRQLVLKIRREGAMRGGIFMRPDFHIECLDQVRAEPSIVGRNLVDEVSVTEPYPFGDHGGKRYRVGVLDFGVKRNSLRLLDAHGFAVTVLPARTPFSSLKEQNFDCYFLSNGPGDPGPLDFAIELVREILSEGKPVLAICLGHQLVGLASGFVTGRLKFGHRGTNQPVLNRLNGRVEITSQNHGFAVERGETHSAKITHVNLNDDTVEGFVDMERNVLSVQYHPEAAPGPHDTTYLFREFFGMVEAHHTGRRLSV